MCQIKHLFRAKSLKSGKWHYGSLLELGHRTQIVYPSIEYLGSLQGTCYVDVNPATVCRLILSKNYNYNRIGQNIFEGDFILQRCKVYLVIFQISDDCQYYNLFIELELDDVGAQIIGNIHDNPELIEKLDLDCYDEDVQKYIKNLKK